MKFNPDQLAILEDESPYIQVIAGAGAGKTSTMIGILDRCIRIGKIPQETCLVLTFSRKATEEFRERLDRLHPGHRIRIQTFHAYCLSVLKSHSPSFRASPPSILTEEEREGFLRTFFQKHRYRIGGIPYRYLLNEEDSLLPALDEELWNLAQRELAEYKIRNGKLEFKDLVTDFLEALRTKQEWTLVPKQESRFLIVDEFQDTDFQQLEFLCAMEPDRLIVVGDDWQAIYGFRGATPRPFLELDRYFTPLKRHFLTVNYRSIPPIVEISQIPIEKNSTYIPKKMRAHREGSLEPELLLLPDGIQGVELATSRILETLKIESDVQVLCRTNFRILEFKQCGVPEPNLMTIHASKGLEFHTVFVDLHDGWNHNPTSLSQEAIEEERRILYVALSRAKNTLCILGRTALQPRKRLEDEFLQYFARLQIRKSHLKAA